MGTAPLLCRISVGEKEMILEERSYDPAARAEELATPALKLVRALPSTPGSSLQVWHMVRSPAVLVVMAVMVVAVRCCDLLAREALSSPLFQGPQLRRRRRQCPTRPTFLRPLSQLR